MTLWKSVVLAVVMAVGFGGQASAFATYSASITSTLTINGFNDGSGFSAALPPGLWFYNDGSGVEPDAPDRATFDSLLDTPAEMSGAFWSGSGAATKNGSVSFTGDEAALAGGSTLNQAASLNGGAGPGAGESIARQLTNGFLTLQNTTANAITVYLTVDYAWSLAASVADTLSEFAGSYVSIYYEAYVPPDFQNPLSADFIVEEARETGDQASYTDSFSGTYAISFTVPANEVVYFDIFVDATGLASIPEPGMAALFGLSLTGLGFARRRRPRTA